jgi:hypothetical protein
MTQFSFDAEAELHIRRAQINGDDAAKALLILAQYLRTGEPVPSNLAKYLADAIEASMAKDGKTRASELLVELGLKAKNRRIIADWLEIGCTVEEQLDSGKSKFNAFLDVAEMFGISEKTVQTYFNQYQKALLITEAINQGKM